MNNYISLLVPFKQIFESWPIIRFLFYNSWRMVLCLDVGLCVNMCVHSNDRGKKYFQCKDVCVCVCVIRERERESERAAFLGVPESFLVVPHSPHFFETFLTRSSSTCVKRSRSFLLTRTRDQLVSNAFVASSSHTPHKNRSLPSIPSANQSVLGLD